MVQKFAMKKNSPSFADRISISILPFFANAATAPGTLSGGKFVATAISGVNSTPKITTKALRIEANADAIR